MSGERILVVDEEGRARRALVSLLKRQEYSVKASATGSSAIADFRNFDPQVVLLELALRDADGFDVCRELRRGSGAAIIVVTTVVHLRTKVRALDEGADDYLVKPVATEELLARIRAVIRRTSDHKLEPQALHASPLRIDMARHEVFVDGERVHLAPTEFELLVFLARNSGRVVRHEEILHQIWGTTHRQTPQNLRTYIKQLRARLRDDPAVPRFIRTEPRIGYRFLLTNL